MIVNFTPWSALLGGALIGLAASLLLVTNGRVAGISGIWSGLLWPEDGEERGWRFAFVAGLAAGAPLLLQLRPEAFGDPPGRATAVVLVGGLLVGFGASMGTGCTSGHGVCGLSRLSPRSLVSVLVFMGVGFALASALGFGGAA
jgi:uncharacterized membrane protein YedE/YeeE